MYPITYEADYTRERNRLTTFFRLIVAIPWLIVSYVWLIAAAVGLLIGFLSLLILGRYPNWAYNIVSGTLRYSTRVNAFASLQTDAYPPFGIGPDPTYPVRLTIPPKADKQSRLKALFRGILAIPLFVIVYPIAFIHSGAVIGAWLTIVFRGYQPAGIHNALAFTSGFNARVSAYLLFLLDAYPPVGDEPPQIGDARGAITAPAPPTDLTAETPSPAADATRVSSEPPAPE